MYKYYDAKRIRGIQRKPLTDPGRGSSAVRDCASALTQQSATPVGAKSEPDLWAH